MENIKLNDYELESGIKSIVHSSIGETQLSHDYTNKLIELYMVCLIVKSYITNRVANNTGKAYFNLFISKLLEFNLYGNNTINTISNMKDSDLLLYRKKFEDEALKLINYLNGDEKKYFEFLKDKINSLPTNLLKDLIKSNFIYHQIKSEELEELQSFYMTLPSENLNFKNNIEKDFERLFDFGKISNSSPKYGVLETCSSARSMGTASNMLFVMKAEINALKSHIINTINKKNLNGGGRSI